MALTRCPDCGNDVSDLAPVCPKCGRPIKDNLPEKESPQAEEQVATGGPVSSSSQVEPGQQTTLAQVESPVQSSLHPNYFQFILGALGSLAVCFGVFMPFLASGGCNFNTLFADGSAFGLNMLFWGLISAGLVAIRRFKELAVTSIVVLGLTVFLFVVISGQAGSRSLEYGFGWALLIGGAVGLLIASIMPSKWGRKASVVLIALMILNAVFSFMAVKAFSEITTTAERRGHSPSTQSVLGIDTQPFQGRVTLTSISIDDIPLTKASGQTWDTFQPNPDIFIVITLDGGVVFTSSTYSESTGDVSWSVNREMNLTPSSSFGIAIMDEDVSQHDQMFNVHIPASDLNWGSNLFQYNGMSIMMTFQ